MSQPKVIPPGIVFLYNWIEFCETITEPIFYVKIFKRSLFYLSLLLGVILIASVTSVFLFKDRIIDQFVNEANKSLGTPVKIGKIDVSAWRDFPNLAIIFSDVYVEDSHPGNYPLLTAKTISFYLNPIEVWQGNYNIRGLQISDSETNLKIDKDGQTNYEVVKSSPAASADKKIQFNLKNVILKNTVVNYKDIYRLQDHQFESDQLVASIKIDGRLYDIEADGDVTSIQIGVGSTTLLKNKRFEVLADLTYDDGNKLVNIRPSTLELHHSQFEVKGSYHFQTNNLIDMTCDGKNTDIQTLLSLLPETINQRVSQYQSKGDVYFNMAIKGEISKNKEPFLSLQFGCTNTTLFHPDYQSKIENANLEGIFKTPSINSFGRASLTLNNVNGNLNGRSFRTNLSIENFDDPYVTFLFQGALEASSVTNFYPLQAVKELSGDIDIDISFSGRTSLLKRKATAQKVDATGSIKMTALNFVAGKQDVHFKDLNGELQFTKNDLALSNVSGAIENSDFHLNGFFKNIITFLLFENQPIGIETDLRSKYIDLDQLFELGFGQEGSGEYQFNISPDLNLNFNCDIQSMHYKRFKPQHISGNLLIKNQMAVARNVSFDGIGGKLSLNGVMDAKNNKAIEVMSAFKLNGIHIDSAFYIFEDFRQDFIKQEHLKGQAYADVDLEMVLNENLKLFPETLIANISAIIKNGELNNFEPMKRLNRYLDDEGLSKLRFGDLKNEIHIENKTVFIPQMQVISNVTTIQLTGTHTFDQKINYRVIAPLRSKKKIDPDEAFGAIEEDQTGSAKIFLKITGTTDNYTVSYDKEAVKQKISSDLKKEVKELKDAFKLKGKERKKELELEVDEYFEWSDSTSTNQHKN